MHCLSEAVHRLPESIVPSPSSTTARTTQSSSLPLVGFLARVLLLATAMLHPAVGSAATVLASASAQATPIAVDRDHR